MDFNLKHWRDKSEEGQETAVLASAKLPRLLLNSHPEHHQRQSPASAALPLFAPEPASSLSARSSDNSTPASAAKIPRMGSYFSLAQWQELELQALIFRHMTAGAAVPPELLHLVKKSLIPSSPSPPAFYLCNPLHQYYQQYQPALLQSGYWGRAMMDSEPGRCRRTDGKKWRCSRDVVAGHKYCERHMHRGRNRSRKPVETTTSTSTNAFGGGSAGGEALKTIHSTTQGMAASGGGGTPQFSLSGPSSSMDLLHLSRRPSDSIIGFEAQNGGQTCGRDRTLRRFFDDWPRPLHKTEDNATNSGTSATTLSMSTPGNPSSDFSLKLGTGNMEEFRAQVGSGERGRPQVNWGTTWETNRVAPMGGPLAEALRSSMSTSSPTSVLHRLARSSASETSCVSS